MMSEADIQRVIDHSEILMKNEEYEPALRLLQPLECILASWMRGRIYLAVAEKIAGDFVFKHYGTEDQKKLYRDILTCAYEHFSHTGKMLMSASHEIQERLNQTLWYDIGKVENELARTKPPTKDVKSEDCEEDRDYEAEDFKAHENHHIQSMVDQVEYWTL